MGLVWESNEPSLFFWAKKGWSAKGNIGPRNMIKPNYWRKEVTWRLAPWLSDGYH